MDYKNNNISSVIIAGLEYGTGSSRDWAAKGPKLLGVKCVIASSFERIHRSNLVGMGIVPLTFIDENNRITLNLKGDELINIDLATNFIVNGLVNCCIIKDSEEITILLKLEIYTENEIACIKAGGILDKVVKDKID
jgi:aconitate hydratase